MTCISRKLQLIVAVQLLISILDLDTQQQGVAARA